MTLYINRTSIGGSCLEVLIMLLLDEAFSLWVNINSEMKRSYSSTSISICNRRNAPCSLDSRPLQMGAYLPSCVCEQSPSLCQ